MIRLRRPGLPADAARLLKAYQAEVDAAPNHAARVEMAKARFQRRNRPNNPAFREVRAALARMCHGARRCMYREDAPADEVEHFRPKNRFPGRAFVWSNYLYSCGPCNGPKNDRWGVLSRSGATVVEAARTATAPPTGRPALIDPSREDPLEFLTIDLQTFVIVPMPGLTPRKRARADYTIEVLNLNKEFLIQSRSSAHKAYLAFLNEAVAAKTRGAPVPAHLREAVRETYHPMVWAEMMRQRLADPALAKRFAAVPEALRW